MTAPNPQSTRKDPSGNKLTVKTKPPHAEEYDGGSESDFGSANELCSVDDKASNCDSDNPEQENTTLADENSDTELNINTKSEKLRRLTVKVCTSSSASGLAWA
ncbi:hypothetical protein PtA15_13A180 [Puccinia triticina]|uniref:Uncharacterized protein n=1 Tax=Puccinia triticina TaxID=208348 RepID=A0ABY7D015_9BASI|nr:uncharacterized protein PtA15_13A180 [Puccinia triticina]WAQ90781.1 hypothetical protein PtA15_13A180 [Puccinia triticina]